MILVANSIVARDPGSPFPGCGILQQAKCRLWKNVREPGLSRSIVLESTSLETKLRRRFKRKSYGQVVVFHVNGVEDRGFSADISAGGMFIQTKGIYPVGSDIVLKLTLKSSNEGETVLHGKISRVTREGIAVQFAH